MENRKSNIDEEISRRKAEKGIENMELIYQQLQNEEQLEEDENADVDGARFNEK